MAGMYSIFDPSINAYREVSVELAVQYVQSAEKTKQELIDDGIIEG